MILDLYVADDPMELSAELPATPLRLLPDPTLSLLAGGYSLVGPAPGPKDFPEIEPPYHNEEEP